RSGEVLGLLLQRREAAGGLVVAADGVLRAHQGGQGEADRDVRHRAGLVQDHFHQSVQFLRRGDDQEVVAADVADLHRAQLRRRVGEAAADAADQVVPGGEPGGVVDLLELVHVQPADGEHVPGGDPAGDVPGDGVAAG